MKKAQAALEFLFVIGFAMLLLLPSLGLFALFVQESSSTVTANQVETLGNTFLNTATQVAASGEGATLVLEDVFPDRVISLEIQNNNELAFSTSIGGVETTQVYYSSFSINGIFTADDVSKGNKKFSFQLDENGIVAITRSDN